MAEALIVQTRTSFDAAQASDPEKIALLESVVESLGDAPALRAHALATLALELIFVGDFERRGRMLDAAIALRASPETRSPWPRSRCSASVRGRVPRGRPTS